MGYYIKCDRHLVSLVWYYRCIVRYSSGCTTGGEGQGVHLTPLEFPDSSNFTFFAPRRSKFGFFDYSYSTLPPLDLNPYATIVLILLQNISRSNKSSWKSCWTLNCRLHTNISSIIRIRYIEILFWSKLRSYKSSEFAV